MSYTEQYRAISDHAEYTAGLMATHSTEELAAMGIDSTSYTELDTASPRLLGLLQEIPEDFRALPLGDVLYGEYEARLREEAERVYDWSDYYAVQAKNNEEPVMDYDVQSVVSGTALAMNDLPRADDLVAHPAGIPLQPTFLAHPDAPQTSINW